MSSILTNNGAATALQTMRNINDNLSETQARISTGLQVRSGKDNAAYFSIAKTMDGDSGMYKAVQEGMTLAKNSVSTSRMGAEKVVDLTKEFAERVAFAQGDTVDKAEVKKELSALVDRINTTIEQSSFNGHSLIKAGSTDLDVVTGIKRDNGFDVSTTSVTAHNLEELTQDPATLSAGKFSFSEGTAGDDFGDDYTNGGGAGLDAGEYNLKSIVDGIATADSAEMADYLVVAERAMETAIGAATDLGVAEKTLETQQDFLSDLTDQLDSGVGAMVDANMEEEAARLQALQVQQQLATQALSIANQAPQNIQSLFR